MTEREQHPLVGDYLTKVEDYRSPSGRKWEIQVGGAEVQIRIKDPSLFGTRSGNISLGKENHRSRDLFGAPREVNRVKGFRVQSGKKRMMFTPPKKRALPRCYQL